MQDAKSLDVLLSDAAEAQMILKQSFAPKSEWASTVMDSNFPNRVGRAEAKQKRVFLNERRRHGQPDEIYDPGIKSRERLGQKVKTKYGGDFKRARDVARLALQFNNCQSLLDCVQNLSRKNRLTVAEVENRFAAPTAIGWRDVTAIVTVKLSSGRRHLAEIQFHLIPYSRARIEAHVHYELLREVLPTVCKVAAEDMEAVESRILDLLTASNVRTKEREEQEDHEQEEQQDQEAAPVALPASEAEGGREHPLDGPRIGGEQAAAAVESRTYGFDLLTASEEEEEEEEDGWL